MADRCKVYIVGKEPRQKGSMSFPVTATAEQINAFFSAYSKAGVVSGVSITGLTVTVTAAEAGSNIDYQCCLRYRLKAEKFGKTHRLSLMSVKYVPELDPNGHGKQLTSVDKAACATALEGIMGLAAGDIDIRRARFLQRS